MEGSHGRHESIQKTCADHRIVRTALGEHGRLDEAAETNGEVKPTPAPQLFRYVSAEGEVRGQNAQR